MMGISDLVLFRHYGGILIISSLGTLFNDLLLRTVLLRYRSEQGCRGSEWRRYCSGGGSYIGWTGYNS